MSFRLKKSNFDRARPIADQITSRGWIWQELETLDGLCCIKSWFEEQSWIQTMTPWLDRVGKVLESDDYILILFEKKLELDCNSLGRLLPLAQSDGVLSSFDVHLERLDRSDRASLDGKILLHYGGLQYSEDLADFKSVNPAEWWLLDDIPLQKSFMLPQNEELFAERIKTKHTVEFDPAYKNAGFSDIQKNAGNCCG